MSHPPARGVPVSEILWTINVPEDAGVARLDEGSVVGLEKEFAAPDVTLDVSERPKERGVEQHRVAAPTVAGRRQRGARNARG